jgi:hypothetical protein
MIDELVLERIFEETADEIAVPEGNMTRVIDEIERAAREPRHVSVARPVRVLAGIAAAVVVVVGLGALLSHAGSGSSEKSTSSAVAQPYTPAITHGPAGAVSNGPGVALSGTAPAARSRRAAVEGGSGAGASTDAGSTPSAPTDGAKIVKTATLDLQVKHDTLPTAVNRVTAVAAGLDGYVANSTTNLDVDQPTGQITLRVPVDNFDAAIKQLKTLPDVKVLGDSETGKDVTAQYTDLQAQLTAAQTEEGALNTILAGATSIPDILNVRDRITAVQTEINQLQGQINLLGDKSDFSAIAVTLAEKTAAAPVAKVSAPPTGLSKAWNDARSGFSSSLEWMLARSGGALIILIALFLLALALRYLYPVVRRALL